MYVCVCIYKHTSNKKGCTSKQKCCYSSWSTYTCLNTHVCRYLKYLDFKKEKVHAKMKILPLVMKHFYPTSKLSDITKHIQFEGADRVYLELDGLGRPIPPEARKRHHKVYNNNMYVRTSHAHAHKRMSYTHTYNERDAQGHAHIYTHTCTHTHTHVQTNAQSLSLTLSLAFFLSLPLSRMHARTYSRA